MSGKVALVTGGSRGTGKAMTGVLLKHGYKVSILSVNESRGKGTAEEFCAEFGSGSCVFYKCDVTKTEELKKCYEKIEDTLGKVTLVVNNSGIADELDWQKMLDVNLKAVMDMTYVAVDKMRKDKGGHGGTIVNHASMAGLVPWIGFPAYTATKYGVVGFTQSMQASLDLAELGWGISLLTLCPSFIDTDLISNANLGNEKAKVSPNVPQKPCKERNAKQIQEVEGTISLEDLAEAFDKLMTDNIPGSGLWVRKEEFGGKTKSSYVKLDGGNLEETNLAEKNIQVCTAMSTKIALVTGGSRGIGKSITGVLLKLGYKVAILSLNETRGKETAEEFCSQFGSGSCVFYKCDVTKTEELQDSYAKTEETLGKVTMVVNNAGISEELDWQKMLDVNLKAMIDLTFIAVEKMRKDKGGSGGTIVNHASMAGLFPWTGFPSYVASKYGIIGFTQSMQASINLAEEDWGISLLNLCPAFIQTDMVKTAKVSPYVPQMPCKELVQKQINEMWGFVSMEDLSVAFEKLITDNRPGSIMVVRTDEVGGPGRGIYVQQNLVELDSK